MVNWKINKHLYNYSEESLQAAINNRLDLWDFVYIGYNGTEKIYIESVSMMIDIRLGYLEYGDYK